MNGVALIVAAYTLPTVAVVLAGPIGLLAVALLVAVIVHAGFAAAALVEARR